jgi:hypothetical protein
MCFNERRRALSKNIQHAAICSVRDPDPVGSGPGWIGIRSDPDPEILTGFGSGPLKMLFSPPITKQLSITNHYLSLKLQCAHSPGWPAAHTPPIPHRYVIAKTWYLEYWSRSLDWNQGLLPLYQTTFPLHTYTHYYILPLCAYALVPHTSLCYSPPLIYI